MVAWNPEPTVITENAVLGIIHVAHDGISLLDWMSWLHSAGYTGIHGRHTARSWPGGQDGI